MTTNTKIQHIDLWEAWVEVQENQDYTTATLYIIGEVTVNNTILEPKFEKMQAPAGQEERLFLQIQPGILCEDGLDTEVLYAETLATPEQYKGVTIMAGDEVLVEMDELEFLYA